MTVKELRKVLKKYPPDANVRCFVADGTPALWIKNIDYITSVWIQLSYAAKMNSESTLSDIREVPLEQFGKLP